MSISQLVARLKAGEISEEVFLNGLMELGVGGEQLFGLFANDPTIQQKLASRMEQDAKIGKAQGIVNLLTNLGLTAASINQIIEGNRYANEIQVPSIPGVPGKDPMLREAIYRAGNYDPGAVLDPAKQGIQDAYINALGQAQISSGGQAGSYQSLANLANLQRMRASLGLSPIAQDLTNQNRQLQAQLVGMGLDETQRGFQNQMAAAGLAFDQYNRDTEAAGSLASQGLSNLFNAGLRTQFGLERYIPYFSKDIAEEMNTTATTNNEYRRNPFSVERPNWEFKKPAMLEPDFEEYGYSGAKKRYYN